MKDGQIVESGTHEELMEKGGVYKGLYLKQQNMECIQSGGTVA